MRSAERIVPAVAPAAGLEHEDPARAVPEWASSMAAEWRAALVRFPRAVVGAMAGLGVDRAARLVDGGGVPTPSEARAIDGALQTDASRLLPPRRPFVQRLFEGPLPGSTTPRRTHALNESRRARVEAWTEKVEHSRLTLTAIAQATGIGPGRLNRIVRQGAIADHAEAQSLVTVLERQP